MFSVTRDIVSAEFHSYGSQPTTLPEAQALIAELQQKLQWSELAYTMVQGVFQVFRRRLEVKEAIRFLNVLPVGARALFVADWDIDEAKRPFEDRAAMTKEVRALRAEHNFSPDTAIHDVAIALRRNVDQTAFDGVLATLPQGAAQFWQP